MKNIPERYILFGVIVATLLLLFGGLLLPGRPPEQPINLPWQVDVFPDGSTRVLGITLGHTTLEEAQHIYREEAKITLFTDLEDGYDLEAYFHTLDISGLRAGMVATLDLDDAQLRAMFARGERIARTSGGEKKVTLGSEDIQMVLRRPIIAITYLPRAEIDEEIAAHRFGLPVLKVREKSNPVTHWLYPEWGIDLVLNSEEKEIIQYVLPARFNALRQPLLKEGVVIR